MFSVSELRNRASRRHCDLAGLPPSSFHRWRLGEGDLTATQLCMLAGAMGWRVVLMPVADADALEEAQAAPATPVLPPSALRHIEGWLEGQLVAVRALSAVASTGCAAVTR